MFVFAILEWIEKTLVSLDTINTKPSLVLPAALQLKALEASLTPELQSNEIPLTKHQVCDFFSFHLRQSGSCQYQSNQTLYRVIR